MENKLEEIKNLSRKFTEERDWQQFHNPKNLVMAMFKEVGELGEIFQWKKCENSILNKLTNTELLHIKEEMADVFIYLLRLSDELNIDLISSAFDKIEKNSVKYPIAKSKGVSTKHNNL